MRCRDQGHLIEHRYIGGYWPKVKEAPDPTLIIWGNLGIGAIARCGRSACSNLIALIFLVIGFGIIILLINEQAKYNTGSEDCGEAVISLDRAYEEYVEEETIDTPSVNCYCLQEFKQVNI